MKISIKFISAFVLSCLTIISCKVEDEIPVTPLPQVVCITQVTYYSPNVCSDLPTAAAVSLADSSLLIISNFFDFADSTSIVENQSLNMDYTNVDSTLFNFGALCGAAIVAPVAEITCLQLN
jgi:hypothetical protein